MTQDMTILQRRSVETSALDLCASAASRFAPDWIIDKRPSLLVIGPPAAQPHLRAIAEEAGARCLGNVVAEAAYARLTQTADVDVVVLDVTHPGFDMSGLFPLLAVLARDERTALVIATQLQTLDAYYAAFDLCMPMDAPVQWLCEPDEGDWKAALKLALKNIRAPLSLHDSGRQRSNEQLDQLSAEVERLSRRLESLRNGDAADTAGKPSSRVASPKERMRGFPSVATGGSATLGIDEDVLNAATVRDLLRSRRLRAEFFGDDLFADPAWDMILDLMAARLEGERVSVSSLCIAAAVPPTTALRWIKNLTERGIFERRPDPQDGRRVFIALSEKSATAVHRWYAATRRMRREELE